MSCNGCRVLRKGCSETCVLRHCLAAIEGSEAQGHATIFLAKFYGRAGLMGFISAIDEAQRPALFQSLLFEACGRTINPVYGAAGLLWSGQWHVCEAAVESVLKGGNLQNFSISAYLANMASGGGNPGAVAGPGMTHPGPTGLNPGAGSVISATQFHSSTNGSAGHPMLAAPHASHLGGPGVQGHALSLHHGLQTGGAASFCNVPGVYLHPGASGSSHPIESASATAAAGFGGHPQAQHVDAPTSPLHPASAGSGLTGVMSASPGYYSPHSLSTSGYAVSAHGASVLSPGLPPAVSSTPTGISSNPAAAKQPQFLNPGASFPSLVVGPGGPTQYATAVAAPPGYLSGPLAGVTLKAAHSDLNTYIGTQVATGSLVATAEGVTALTSHAFPPFNSQGFHPSMIQGSALPDAPSPAGLLPHAATFPMAQSLHAGPVRMGPVPGAAGYGALQAHYHPQKALQQAQAAAAAGAFSEATAGAPAYYYSSINGAPGALLRSNNETPGPPGTVAGGGGQLISPISHSRLQLSQSPVSGTCSPSSSVYPCAIRHVSAATPCVREPYGNGAVLCASAAAPKPPGPMYKTSSGSSSSNNREYNNFTDLTSPYNSEINQQMASSSAQESQQQQQQQLAAEDAARKEASAKEYQQLQQQQQQLLYPNHVSAADHRHHRSYQLTGGVGSVDQPTGVAVGGHVSPVSAGSSGLTHFGDALRSQGRFASVNGGVEPHWAGGGGGGGGPLGGFSCEGYGPSGTGGDPQSPPYPQGAGGGPLLSSASFNQHSLFNARRTGCMAAPGYPDSGAAAAVALAGPGIDPAEALTVAGIKRPASAAGSIEAAGADVCRNGSVGGTAASTLDFSGGSSYVDNGAGEILAPVARRIKPRMSAAVGAVAGGFPSLVMSAYGNSGAPAAGIGAAAAPSRSQNGRDLEGQMHERSNSRAVLSSSSPGVASNASPADNVPYGFSSFWGSRVGPGASLNSGANLTNNCNNGSNNNNLANNLVQHLNVAEMCSVNALSNGGNLNGTHSSAAGTHSQQPLLPLLP